MNVDSAYLNNLYTIALFTSASAGQDVHIAGGAIRDMLIEKEIADIDVFHNGELSLSALKTFFNKVEECEYGVYEDTSFNVKYKVWMNTIPVPIQLIEVKGSVLEHINKFPTRLSRVYYKQGGLHNITPLFELDVKHKEVYFDLPVNHQYCDKMMKKFPDWQHTFAKPEYSPFFF